MDDKISPLPYVTLAAAAELLGGRAEVDTATLDNWNGPAVLMTLPGLTLDIHNSAEPGRMTVTVELSHEEAKHRPGSLNRPAIGIGAARPAAAIAAEITRRLLPEARRYVGLVAANLAHAQARARELAALIALLETAGARPDRDQRDSLYQWTAEVGAPNTKAHITANAGGGIEIKIHTDDSDLAAAIIHGIEIATREARARELAEQAASEERVAALRAQHAAQPR